MTSSARDKRLWLGGGVAVVVIVALAAWLLLIGPALTDTRDLRGQTDAVRLENAALSARTTALRTKYTHLTALRADVTDALAALPPDTGLPELSRQLSRQARENDVVLDSIQVAASTSAGVDPATGATDPATPTGTVAIPVTLLSRGSADQQRGFLRSIQLDGPRRALVTSASLTATARGSVDSRASMTTQITVFTAPLPPAQRAQLDKLLDHDQND